MIGNADNESGILYFQTLQTIGHLQSEKARLF